MRITETELRQVIREELSRVNETIEFEAWEDHWGQPGDVAVMPDRTVYLFRREIDEERFLGVEASRRGGRFRPLPDAVAIPIYYDEVRRFIFKGEPGTHGGGKSTGVFDYRSPNYDPALRYAGHEGV